MNLSALNGASKFGGSKFKNFAEPGVYKAIVEAADMKQSKDTTKPPYLSVRFGLYQGDKRLGGMFDIFSEPTKNFTMYKLSRFLKACNIPLEGDMELKDIALLVKDCEITLWAQEDEWNGTKRLAANLRDAEGYYTASELQEITAVYNKAMGITSDVCPTSFSVDVDDDSEEEVPFDTDEF